MSRTEPAEFTVMCMVEDGRGNVLVQDRADKNWPGIVFPGGHVEPRESFVRAVVREMYEETGLTVENPVLCGVKQFQDGRRYVVLLYRASRFTGVLRSSDEGRVFWTPLAELPQARLADSFQDMLEVFLADSPRELYYGDAGAEIWPR